MAFYGWLTFAFMMHKFLGGIFSLWVLSVRARDSSLSQGIFLTIITQYIVGVTASIFIPVNLKADNLGLEQYLINK